MRDLARYFLFTWTQTCFLPFFCVDQKYWFSILNLVHLPCRKGGLEMPPESICLRPSHNYRIAVIGAGAIGSALGALLHRAGQDVVLIGRSAHVSAIRNEGLKVDGDAGTFTANINAVEALTFRPDLALLTVKTQDVVKAVETQKAFLRDIPVVTFQNGIRSDDIVSSILPKEQILSAVVLMHATYLLPGKVTIVYRGQLMLGSPYAATNERLHDVAQTLNLAVPARVTDNIQGAHWLKLIINLNNALPAITNQTMDAIYANASLRNLAVRLMREGLLVINRARIRLESLPEVSVVLTKLVNWMPLGIAGRIAGVKVRRLTTQWPLWGSTLQSIQRGRRTEIDYLNGEVVKLGKRFGEATPLNAKMVELVHRVESTAHFLSLSELAGILKQ
jgi:2-dehydropantoate 2-reductase